MSKHTFELLSAYTDSSVVCIFEDGTTQSAAELRAGVQKIARGLRHLSPIGAGSQTVLVVCDDKALLLATSLAVWAQGGVVVLAPNQAPETLASVATESGSYVVAVNSEKLKRHLETELSSVAVADVNSWLKNPEPASMVSLQLPKERPVASVYTSGSTGSHRRCDKSAEQLSGEAGMLAKTFALGPTSLVGSTVPVHHLYGLLFGLLMPLAAGARFVNTLSLGAATRHPPISDLVLVPVHARALIEDERISHLHGVRAFCSGGTLDRAVATAFVKHTEAELVDVLGSSESGGIGYRQAAQESRYRAFDGVHVSRDELGNLLLRSRFLPDHGADFQLMADQIRLDSGGGFSHLGRADGVIKIGGKRAAVQEIQRRAIDLPGITDAAVLVQQTPQLRGTEVWLAVASKDARWTKTRLRGALGAHFDDVVLPRRTRRLDELPRDPLGKLSRLALLSLFEDQERAATPPYLGPARWHGEDACEFAFSIPSGLPHFNGHFEGFPVLPGVAQLTELILPAVHLAFPELATLRLARRLKFCSPITPGCGLRLRLKRRPPAAPPPTNAALEGRVSFKLFLRAEADGDTVISTSPTHDKLAATGDLILAPKSPVSVD